MDKDPSAGPTNGDGSHESKCSVGEDGVPLERSLPLSVEAFGEAIQAFGKNLLRRFLSIGVRNSSAVGDE